MSIKLSISLIATVLSATAFAQPKDAPKPAGAAVAPTPPAPPAKPTPPPEIAELAKTLVGTWKCTGQMMDMKDMTKMVAMKPTTIVYKLDLDKFWIAGTLTGPFKAQFLTTFDASTKKFYRHMADNMGGSDVAWTTGVAAGKIVWDGESRGAGVPTGAKSRETDEVVSAKEIKMTGEGSMDGGKKYMKMWEATCKK